MIAQGSLRPGNNSSPTGRLSSGPKSYCETRYSPLFCLTNCEFTLFCSHKSMKRMTRHVNICMLLRVYQTTWVNTSSGTIVFCFNDTRENTLQLMCQLDLNFV